MSGSQVIVKLLPTLKVKKEIKVKFFRILLFLNSYKGQKVTVDILLNTDAPDINVVKLMYFAAKERHSDVVKVILGFTSNIANDKYATWL